MGRFEKTLLTADGQFSFCDTRGVTTLQLKEEFFITMGRYGISLTKSASNEFVLVYIIIIILIHIHVLKMVNGFIQWA